MNGKVGEGGRGRNEGYGKWVELADLPTLHMQPLSNIYVSVVYSVLVGDSNCVCVRELTTNVWIAKNPGLSL